MSSLKNELDMDELNMVNRSANVLVHLNEGTCLVCCKTCTTRPPVGLEITGPNTAIVSAKLETRSVDMWSYKRGGPKTR